MHAPGNFGHVIHYQKCFAMVDRFGLKVLRLPKEMMGRHTEICTEIPMHTIYSFLLSFIWTYLLGPTSFRPKLIGPPQLFGPTLFSPIYLDLFWNARYLWLPRSCKTKTFCLALIDLKEKQWSKQSSELTIQTWKV